MVVKTIIPIFASTFKTLKMSITEKRDFYDHRKPELKERTKKRLLEIEKCGMTEVGFGQFGVKGVMSGLYIEIVWTYSDEEFEDYMTWAKEVIQRKK